MRSIITKCGTMCGLVVIIWAACGFGLLGSTGSWSASTVIPAGSSAVVIDPSLASVLGPETTVAVRAVGSTQQIFLGRARPDDAAALVAPLIRSQIDGLAGPRQLKATLGQPAPAIDPVSPKLSAADIWHEHLTGMGSVVSTTKAQPGGESVVVASTDGKPLPALRVTLTWSNPWWLLWPFVLAGVGLVLLTMTTRPLHDLLSRGRAKAQRDGLRSAAKRTAEVTAERGRRGAERTLESAQRTRRGTRRAGTLGSEIADGTTIAEDTTIAQNIEDTVDVPAPIDRIPVDTGATGVMTAVDFAPGEFGTPDYLAGEFAPQGQFPHFSDPQAAVTYDPIALDHTVTSLPVFTAPDTQTDDPDEQPWTEPPLTRSQATARRRSQSRWRR
jgi:hypothetical protein